MAPYYVSVIMQLMGDKINFQRKDSFPEKRSYFLVLCKFVLKIAEFYKPKKLGDSPAGLRLENFINSDKK